MLNTDIDKYKIYKAELKDCLDSIYVLNECKDLMNNKGFTLADVMLVKSIKNNSILIAEIKELGIDICEKEKSEKLKTTINALNGIIDDIKDEQMKQIVYLHTLKGYTWRQIGKLIHMNYSAVRKKYYKYLKG